MRAALKSFVLPFLLLPAIELQAQQLSFHARRDYLAGVNPQQLAVGDFNHDGNPDIVAAGSTLSVLLGKPDGSFSAPLEIKAASGLSSSSVAVADFNGDGNLDLAVNDTYSGGSCCIYLFFGNGDGTFRSGTTLNVIFGVGFVAAADVNNDGKADLIIANGHISVLLGHGDGTFGAPFAVGVNGGFLAVTADFNNDGILDIAAFANGYPQPSSVVILLGNGDGTFRSSATYSFPSSGNSLATGDVNGDHKSDLVVATLQLTANSTSAWVMLGNGDGTFQPPGALSNSFSGAVAVGDLNGDGLADVVVAGSADNVSAAKVFISKGNGQFRPPTSYTIDGSAAVVLADFAQDGSLDIATASGNAGISVLLNTGDGHFVHSDAFPASAQSYQIAAGDFDGDGLPDLVTTDHQTLSQDISVVLNQGRGAFGAPTTITLPGAAGAVVTGDFNNDGKLDIAVGTIHTSYGVTVLPGNGDGTFQPAITTTLPMAANGLAAGDFNRDGKRDLAVGQFGNLAILLGNGDGTFQLPVEYSLPGAGGCCYAGILIADVNGDGNLDLVTSGAGDRASIYVLLGNGDGTFQPALEFPSGLLVDSLTAADFNGDGKPDLALVAGSYAYNSRQVMIALGNGDGTFQPLVPYYAGFTASQIAAADFNGDGAIDLAVSNGSDMNLGLLRGNGDGTFQPVEFFGAADNPHGLVALNLNRDHKPDIAAACLHSGVCILLNDSR